MVTLFLIKMQSGTTVVRDVKKHTMNVALTEG